MATPDPNNLRIGAANVYFDRFDVNGDSTGYRHVGNCQKFSTTAAVEKLEKKSSMDGTRSTLKEVIIGSSLDITLILDELDAQNLALLLLGEAGTFTQAAATVTAEPINGGVAIVLDRWYNLGKIDLSNVDIKQGGPALTLTTDYELDTQNGRVKILSTGGGAAAITTWDGDHGAVSTSLITALSVGNIEGALQLIDAVDMASGIKYKIDVHKVNLTPDGETDFISEEWTSGTVKGKAQKDVTKPAGQEYMTMIELSASTADGS